MTAVIIGLGELLVDKQRELSYYRCVSVGSRQHKLEEEHDQLLAFMKQTPAVAKEHVESVPTPLLPKKP